MILAHLFAFIAFIASYLVALQFVLAHEVSQQALGWALAFGFMTAMPALAFWGIMFALFLKFRWGATIFLLIMTIAIPFYFGVLTAPGRAAFFQAMVIATLAHQLILLLGTRAVHTQWPPPPV